MKNIGKRVLSLLFVAVMLLSMVALPGWNAQAAGEDSLPAQLQGVNSKHLKIYDSKNFALDGGGEITSDPESPTGQAFFAAGLKLGNYIDIYRYASYGTTFNQQYFHLLEIKAAEVKMNAGYQLYKSTVTVPEDMVSGNYVYVEYDGWKCLNSVLAADLKILAGKTVDFYISMKVNGDAANGDMYVDRMFLVSHCEDHKVGTTCSLCGEELGGDPVLGTVPEALQKADPQHVKKYDTANFGKDGGGSIVADAEAAGGKAFSKSGLNIGSAIDFYRYSANGSSFDKQYLHLLEIPADNVKMNAGYQYYKGTIDVPANIFTPTTYVYMQYDGWICQNVKLANDLTAFAGKKVDFYVSMKIVGDSASNTTVYVDQMFLVDRCENYADENGTTCTLCGATIEAANPGPVVPPATDKVEYVYTADNFTLAKAPNSGDAVVNDSTSAYGKAAKFSYQSRVAAGCEEGDLNSLLRVGQQSLTLYTYGGKPAESRPVISLSIDELKANAAGGQYVEYTVKDVDLIPTGDNYFLYLFDCWGFQLHITSDRQQAIHNGLVDVTLSLKVEGDVSDKNNPPTYYIDMVSIKAAESGTQIHRHEFGAWTAEANTHSTTCATCGEVKTEFHKWDDGVVVKEPTEEEMGVRSYTCTECGATKTEEFGNTLRLVFHADSFTLPKKGDTVVSDPTSSVGMAAMLSYDNRAASEDPDGAKGLLYEEGTKMAIYNYGGSSNKESYKIGELASANLVENARGGEYVTYKFKNVKIVPEEGTYFLYMFSDWGFQIRFNQAQVEAMLGKRVDVFLSMKVTGRPTSKNRSPVYYIDEVIIQETSSEGDEFIPYVPNEAPKGANTGLPAEYKAEDFRLPLATMGSGDAVVSDPVSVYGKAVMLSYEKRKGDELRGDAMIFAPGQELRLYTDNTILVGAFSTEELQANSAGGKYVVYEFKNVNLTGAKYMYLFNCWGFQIPMEYLASDLTGKQVDVKISLRVTGDVTSKTDNTPAYYIDYLSITEAEPVEEHEHTYGEWSADTLNHTASCTICGLKIEGFHSWDEGVVTKEATETENGETVYTCKVCGYEDAKKIKATGSATKEEPENTSDMGLIIGCVAAGLFAIVAAVVVLIIVKKSGKKS